jgi:hypothetical protein
VNHHEEYKLRQIIREVLTQGTLQKPIYYHGTNSTLEDTLKKDYVFISTSRLFSKNYGENVFELNANLGKIFYSYKLDDIKKIYSAGFFLTDPYLDQSDDNFEGYNYKLQRYDTPEDFIKVSDQTNNTWEPIEKTEGVVNWIFSNGYDSIAILEDGILNYLIPLENIILIK